MPVRRTIQVSSTPSRPPTSALVTTCSGRAVPSPTTPAVRTRGGEAGAGAGAATASGVDAMELLDRDCLEVREVARNELGQDLVRPDVDEGPGPGGAERG